MSFVAVDEVDNEEQDPNGKNFGQFAKAFARAGSFVKLSSEEAQIGEIKKRVDVARKAGKLDLSGLGIKALPQIAIDLGQAARVVWMHDNQLETLSAAHLTAWKSLAQLKLSSNLLTELPPEVGKCRNLAMLLVDHNRLVAIPSTIAQCKSLTYLSIAHNRISRLPVAVAECARLNEFEFTGNPFAFPHRKILKEGKAGVLKYLKRFTAACKSGVLDLTQADLTELPQEVGYVGAKLRHLKMNDINPPSGFRFPFEIAKCTNLERLELHPQLKILSPPEETAAKGIKVILLYLTRFDRAKETMKLDLSHMNLAGFPLEISAESGMDLGEVRHLVLDDNNITAIPQALSLLPGLTRLDASRNELKTLPAALARLPLLEAMVVEQNRLLEVSEALGKIPLLTSLSLRANRIAQIAPGLVNMSALRHLDLGENALRALSVHLGNWQARPLQLPPPPPSARRGPPRPAPACRTHPVHGSCSRARASRALRRWRAFCSTATALRRSRARCAGCRASPSSTSPTTLSAASRIRLACSRRSRSRLPASSDAQLQHPPRRPRSTPSRSLCCPLPATAPIVPPHRACTTNAHSQGGPGWFCATLPSWSFPVGSARSGASARSTSRAASGCARCHTRSATSPSSRRRCSTASRR